MMEKRFQGWPEFVAELKACGQWPFDDAERRDRLSREWQVRADEFFAQEEGPIIGDLEAVGVRVASVWDIANSKRPCAKAVPVLMRHLERSYHPNVLDGMARAVAIPEAQPYWATLLRLYRAAGNNCSRDGLALALTNSAGPEHFSQLADLAADKSNGPSRGFFMHGLSKLPYPQVWQVIEGLRDDSEIGRGARDLLARKARRRK